MPRAKKAEATPLPEPVREGLDPKALEAARTAKNAMYPLDGTEAAIRAYLAAMPVEAVRQVSWLIERKDDAVFQRPHWYHEEPSGWHWWTVDAHEAKKFASKAEAEAFPAYQMIASDPAISITEHVFLAPAIAPAIQAVPGDMEAFGLDAESIEAFRFNSLKPEEIAGDARTQAKRIGELLHWFARLQRGSANPKWTMAHAMELAYYIATTDDRAPIDIAQIEKDAWLKGVKATHDERGMMLRLGMITKAEFDAALAGQVSLPASEPVTLPPTRERVEYALPEEERFLRPDPAPCGLADPSYRDCKNMKEVGGGFDGERYRCAVCGKGYFLDYEDMK
ncbi:MAG: hypothetical protein EOS20_18430 [Mesorhizobium sp.]|uniref:hypothetical protein n=1 Tax=Mesorhizobium sp. TaxID=1871066 RepID=UPI000FE768CE|nr:hypothetical protein [Mesorhizobium sp.]RWQ35486.1 MAG: hypothetical protein EOS20_18430 [Mesorhizobium sp.]RWQ38684.1 MAG: hypothetical protein EOS21_19280 [Mesorhizobium sp.]